MDYSDMSTERIQAAIERQQATIKRAEGFKRALGVTNHEYQSYTRGIKQAQDQIAEYQAELARR